MTATQTAEAIRQELDADLIRLEDALINKVEKILAKRIEESVAEEYVLDVFIANVQAIVQGQSRGE